MIQVPETYIREANEALRERLDQALDRDGAIGGCDWNEVEAVSAALVDLAQTFTKPHGPNGMSERA